MVHCAGHMPSRTVAVPPRVQDRARSSTVQLPSPCPFPSAKDAGNGRREGGGESLPRR